jgi:hypothetical protein
MNVNYQQIQYIRPSIEELQELHTLPDDTLHAIGNPNSLGFLIKTLMSTYPSVNLSAANAKRTWELVGLVYKDWQRHQEALVVFQKLYEQMLVAQHAANSRCHKGMPLCWMSDCYFAIGYPLISLRYLTLTLVEDAITGQGKVSPETTGVYWRLVFRGWLSESQIQRYAEDIYNSYDPSEDGFFYPEWVLQKLDRNWIAWAPTPQEAGVYALNVRYLKFLNDRLGDKSGRTLEAIADYLLSCMPGCRTAVRQRSPSTDYDLVCSVEGLESDFRSELGRYFVCECKDWDTPADFSSFAKFCRVLDSVKSRFGIMFCKKGISGEGRLSDSALEQVKVFQDRGIIIVTIDQNDFRQIIDGSNCISMLRGKYENVRLNLTAKTASGRDK